MAGQTSKKLRKENSAKENTSTMNAESVSVPSANEVNSANAPSSNNSTVNVPFREFQIDDISHITDIGSEEVILEERDLSLSGNSLQTTSAKINPVKTNKKIDMGMVWHVRLGHPCREVLKQLQKTCPELKDVVFGDNISQCDACNKAK